MQKLIIQSDTGRKIQIPSKEEMYLLMQHRNMIASKSDNPKTTVVAKEDIEDLKNEMKNLSEMARKISEIYAVQTTAKESIKKIDELHAIQTGKLYNPSKERRLSKKQKEEQELNQLLRDAHLRALNLKPSNRK